MFLTLQSTLQNWCSETQPLHCVSAYQLSILDLSAYLLKSSNRQKSVPAQGGPFPHLDLHGSLLRDLLNHFARNPGDPWQQDLVAQALISVSKETSRANEDEKWALVAAEKDVEAAKLLAATMRRLVIKLLSSNYDGCSRVRLCILYKCRDSKKPKNIPRTMNSMSSLGSKLCLLRLHSPSPRSRGMRPLLVHSTELQQIGCEVLSLWQLGFNEKSFVFWIKNRRFVLFQQRCLCYVVVSRVDGL